MTAPRPGFIHPSAVVGEPPEHREWTPSADCFQPEVADTAQVNAFVTIDAGRHEPTRIGDGTFLMAHVYVGHDAQIGADCELGPGTVIAGHCKIGDRVRFGVNACVRPFITIGDDARIGAGAVVVKHVPAGEVWAGNPARPIRSASASEPATEAGTPS
jgi:UDP-3-O-[3-hydroxymyristoyl] glucosamine N-acyltransferase